MHGLKKQFYYEIQFSHFYRVLTRFARPLGNCLYQGGQNAVVWRIVYTNEVAQYTGFSKCSKGQAIKKRQELQGIIFKIRQQGLFGEKQLKKVANDYRRERKINILTSLKSFCSHLRFCFSA